MRKLWLLPLVALLAACGFEPMYASKTTDVQMGQVNVHPIPEREGQQLRNALLDRGFGDAGAPGGYELTIPTIAVSEIDLGIAEDDTATRRQLTMSVGITLSRDGKQLLARTLTGRTTYNVLISQYTTIVSQDAARRIVIEDLARQIETQIVLTLRQTAP